MYYFTFVQATLNHLYNKTRSAVVTHHYYYLDISSSNLPWLVHLVVTPNQPWLTYIYNHIAAEVHVQVNGANWIAMTTCNQTPPPPFLLQHILVITITRWYSNKSWNRLCSFPSNQDGWELCRSIRIRLGAVLWIGGAKKTRVRVQLQYSLLITVMPDSHRFRIPTTLIINKAPLASR